MKITFQYYQPFAPSIILSSSYVPRQPPLFYSLPSLFVSSLIHVDLFLFFISISSVTVSIDLCAFLSLSSSNFVLSMFHIGSPYSLYTFRFKTISKALFITFIFIKKLCRLSLYAVLYFIFIVLH